MTAASSRICWEDERRCRKPCTHLDKHVIELLKHKLPQGFAWLFDELVEAILLVQRLHLRRRQALVDICAQFLDHLVGGQGPRAY